jgi:hypothetical protein
MALSARSPLPWSPLRARTPSRMKLAKGRRSDQVTRILVILKGRSSDSAEACCGISIDSIEAVGGFSRAL